MGQDAVFDEGSLPGALPPDRAVGVLVGEEPLAEVFAQPPLQFWLSPGGPLNWSQPVEQATTSRFVFPRKDAGLDAIQEVPPPPSLPAPPQARPTWQPTWQATCVVAQAAQRAALQFFQHDSLIFLEL